MVFIPYPAGNAGEQPVSGLPEEMTVQRSLTWWFIEQDPTDVVLTRRGTKVKQPGGGYKMTDSATVDPQRFKFIYGGNTGAGRAGIVEGGDGRHRMFSYVLVAMYNADIEIGDHWTDVNGQHWEVEELLPYNGYEVKATIRSHGSDPQYG